MKTTKLISRKNLLLGSALLGICTTIGTSHIAQAAPQGDNARQYRSNDSDDRNDDGAARDNRDGDRSERKGLRGNRPDGNRPDGNRPDGNRPDQNRPGNRDQRRGPRDQEQGGGYHRDDAQRGNRSAGDRHHVRAGHRDGEDGNRGRYEVGNGNYGSDDFPDRRGDSPQMNNRPGNRFPGGNRGQIGSARTIGRIYIGTVTRVRSNTNFDVSINGSTFNVYLDTPSPRGLTTGDTVRINGVQQDKNDIRNATVSVLRNR